MGRVGGEGFAGGDVKGGDRGRGRGRLVVSWRNGERMGNCVGVDGESIGKGGGVTGVCAVSWLEGEMLRTCAGVDWGKEIAEWLGGWEVGSGDFLGKGCRGDGDGGG